MAVAVLYVTASGALFLAAGWPVVWHFPSTAGWASPVEVADVVKWANAGSPPAAMWRAANGGPELVAAARGLVAFHLLTATGFGLLAVRRLRAEPVPLAPTGEAAASAARPPVGDDPVVWWARYGEGGGGPAGLWGYVQAGAATAAVLAAARAAGLIDDATVQKHVWQIPACMSFCIAGLGYLAAAASFDRDRATKVLDDLRLTAVGGRGLVDGKVTGAAALTRSAAGMAAAVIAGAAVGVGANPIGPLLGVGLAAVVGRGAAGAGVRAAVAGLVREGRPRTPSELMAKAGTFVAGVAVLLLTMFTLELYADLGWQVAWVLAAVGAAAVAAGHILQRAAGRHLDEFWTPRPDGERPDLPGEK